MVVEISNPNEGDTVKIVLRGAMYPLDSRQLPYLGKVGVVEFVNRRVRLNRFVKFPNGEVIEFNQGNLEIVQEVSNPNQLPKGVTLCYTYKHSVFDTLDQVQEFMKDEKVSEMQSLVTDLNLEELAKVKEFIEGLK